MHLNMLSVNFPLENRRSLQKTETAYHRRTYAHPILYIPKAAANHQLAAHNIPYPNQHTKPTPSNLSTSPQKLSLISPASPQSGAAIHPIKPQQQFRQPPTIPLKTIHHTYTDPDTKRRPHKSKEAELIFFFSLKKPPKGERKHTSQTRLQPYPFVDLVHARALAPTIAACKTVENR
jgi:hypothetical protein